MLAQVNFWLSVRDISHVGRLAPARRPSMYVYDAGAASVWTRTVVYAPPLLPRMHLPQTRRHCPGKLRLAGGRAFSSQRVMGRP